MALNRLKESEGQRIKIYVDLRFVEVLFELSGLKNFLIFVEESIVYHQKQFEIRTLADLQTKGIDIYDAEWDLAYQEIDIIKNEIIPQRFRHSFIVSLWSCFEFSIKTIAEHIRNKKDIKETLDDRKIIKKYGILSKRISPYFEEILERKINIDLNTQKLINLLYSLRKSIVHGYGRKESTKKEIWNEIESWAKDNEGIKIERDVVCLSPELLNKFLNIVDSIISNAIEISK